MKSYLLFGLATCICTAAPLSAETVQVGGKAMLASKNIVENAVNSADHTTLVAAVKAAGLVQTLQSAGPFTVFAPVNSAFAALPAGTVESLLKPENKSKLAAILTYHVVPGNLSIAELDSKIKAGKGTAMLKTVQGEMLSVKKNGGNNFIVEDSKGHVANITISDVNQSNGMIHVIDHVLMP